MKRRDFFLASGAAALAPLGMRAAELTADGVLVPARKVPVLAEAEVVVCGGGTAGIAAACCAAKHGAKVLLLERWPSLGGMATNALVNIWHTSDRRKQVIFGFVQEAIERAGGFMQRYPDFPRRYETHKFDPEGMRVVFWQLLRERGVRVLCNVTAVESVVEGGQVCAVLVDTKTGRKAVRGKIFIDATGDGDVAANAGLPFDFGRVGDGRVQGMTMMFELRGADQAVARATPREQVARVLALMQEQRDAGKFPPFNEGHAASYLRSGATGLYNMCPAAGNPLNEEELTQLSEEARGHVYQYRDLWRRELPAFAKAEIVQMGHGLGIRESRRIRGLKMLDGQMVIKAAKQPDAIGHGFWMIDIHDPKGTGYTTHSDHKPGQWLEPGQSYHLPLGICLNAQLANLAVVGRCASTTHEGCASVRLQSHGMVMGQGVGTCAALALRSGTQMSLVDIKKLQATLRSDGVYLEDVPAAALAT